MLFRSLAPICSLAPPALSRWPNQAQRVAASEGQCSVAGPAMHSPWPPPSRDARLSALPGVVHGCPLLVVRPLKPRRVVRLDEKLEAR
jgi:hypothetical protein